MATIPVYTPRVGLNPGSAPSLPVDGSIAAGLQNIGQAGQQFARAEMQRTVTTQVPPVDSEYKRRILDFARTLDNDPDTATVEARFGQFVQQTTAELSGRITDPNARIKWQQAADAWTLGQRDSVLNRAANRKRGQDQTGVITALDAYRDIYVDPTLDDATRAQAQSDIAVTIDQAERTGILDAGQAYNLRKANIDDAELTYAKLWLDANPNAGLPPAPGSKEAVVSKIIGIESGGNASARNPRSSASGLGQFTDSTWLETIDRHRPDLAGLPRDQKLALKTDAALAREMTARHTEDNEKFLVSRGLPVTEGNLYLAHFAGSGGAEKVLTAPDSASVLDVLGANVVRANPFLQGKDVAWLKAWADRKMGSTRATPTDARPPNYDRMDPVQRNVVDDVIRAREAQRDAMLRANLEAVIADAPAAMAATGTYTGTMPTAEDFVRAYGMQGADRFAAFQREVETSREVFSMQTQSVGEIQSTLEEAAPINTGAGAAADAERYRVLSSAASATLKAREADPVGYVQRAFPAVEQAWQAVQAGQGDYASAIRATVAAQRTLGIAPEKIQALPKTITDSVVQRLLDPEMPQSERIGALTSTIFATNDPDQQRAIFDQMVKAGVPEHVSGALRAIERNDEGAARRLFEAALVDPTKLPGKVPETEANIRAQIQTDLMSEGGIGDVYYGLSDGAIENYAKAAGDATLLLRAVQMRMLGGEDLSTAVENAGKDLYGNVRVETGSGDVKTSLILDAEEDAEPIIMGLRAKQYQVSEAMFAAAKPAIDASPASTGEKAIVEATVRNRIADVLSEGRWVTTAGGFGLLDPYTGALAAGADGKPIIFSREDVVASGAATGSRTSVQMPEAPPVSDVQPEASTPEDPMQAEAQFLEQRARALAGGGPTIERDPGAPGYSTGGSF